MPRTTSLRLPTLAATLGLAASVLVGSAAAADPPTGWPAGDWAASCVDDAAQYCIEEATVTPVGGTPTPVAELGLHAAVNTLGGYVNSFNWTVDRWEGETITDEVRNGDVRLVIRTGGFLPRYTMALAKGMRITRSTDDAGNTTMVITGHQTKIHWTTHDMDLFVSCIVGTSCGDADEMADEMGTGYRFMGNTQDLATWGEDAISTLDGMYIATDAQARPTALGFGAGETPSWYLPVLGNVHLDMDGNPVRGSFNAWMPPAYFASLGTTAEAAAGVGFDVVSSTGNDATSVPANVSLADGGVAIDVPDIGYSVHRIDVVGRASTAPAGATVPGAPKSATVTGAANGLKVNWSAPASTGGTPVTSYTARAFTAASGGTIAGSCTGTGTSCTITGLSATTTYHVAVSAGNALGEGPARSPRTATDRPSAAQKVTLTPGNGTLRAAWAAPAWIGGNALTGYTVNAYPAASGGAAVKTCTSTTDARTCTLGGLTNGTKYHVSVSATNTTGTSTESGRVAAAPAAPLGAPTGVAVTPGNGSLGVTWSAPSATGASPLSGYTVKAYLTAAGGSAVKSCTSTVAARACAMTGLTNGTPYHVTVAATTAAGAGPESGPRTAGTPRTVATAPLGVSATASAQKVKVSWKAPASTGGSAVTGYLATVYSAGTGGVVVAQCTANGTALTCTTPALTSGKTYYVSVVAVTAAGSSASSARAAVPVKSQPVKSQPRMV